MELLRRYTLFVYSIWDFILGFRFFLWSPAKDRRQEVYSWGTINLLFTSIIMTLFCLIVLAALAYFIYIGLRNDGSTTSHNKSVSLAVALSVVGIASFYSGLYLNNVNGTKRKQFRKGVMLNIVGALMLLMAAYMYRRQ